MGYAGRAKERGLMQRRRFYAAPDEIETHRIKLSTDESHHLLRVLRLNRGDEVFVFDGCDKEYRCKFEAIEQKRAVLEIVEALTEVVESPLHLTLAQALAKGEKFDFIVQKATELGASRIVPIATDHADLKLNKEQAEKKLERWQRISLEALKQSGRRRLVEIMHPVTLNHFFKANHQAMKEASGEAVNHEKHGDEEPLKAMIFFNERGGLPIKEALAEFSDRRAIAVLVGPEGGWSDDEIALMAAQNCKAVTLGQRILRTETAAITAVVLLQHLLGDLSR
jgi:16S rRNA (uracil1498-N3)-methyltransferase